MQTQKDGGWQRAAFKRKFALTLPSPGGAGASTGSPTGVPATPKLVAASAAQEHKSATALLRFAGAADPESRWWAGMPRPLQGLPLELQRKVLRQYGHADELQVARAAISADRNVVLAKELRGLKRRSQRPTPRHTRGASSDEVQTAQRR